VGACAVKCKGEALLARPARVAVGGAQLIFQIAPLLLQVCNLFLLGFDFRCPLVYFVARILLVQGFGGVGVILDAAFVLFALEDIQFLLRRGNFRS